MRLHQLAFFLALAACQPATDARRENDTRSGREPAGTIAVTPDASHSTAAPPGTDASPSARLDPPELVAEAEQGKKGAINVLLSWAAAIEQREFASARKLFRSSAPADRTPYSDYEDITIGFGNGEIEGAAGSLYYAVPVWLTGKTANGPVRLDGTITLRRTNDVPGSTAEQRRWGIEEVQW